jgi:hypothetical protein
MLGLLQLHVHANTQHTPINSFTRPLMLAKILVQAQKANRHTTASGAFYTHFALKKTPMPQGAGKGANLLPQRRSGRSTTK